MKPPRFEYEAPATFAQALARLRECGEDARPLAGGQSLIPAMNLRLANPGRLLDLRRIAELRGIRRLPGGVIAAGAMTRHADFERDAHAQEHLPIVPAVMRRVAHPQIRHRGTIGGSLAHADPAAEWPALCMLLEATIVVASAARERSIAAADFPLGVYTTALAPGELIREVRFPAWPAGRRWGFEEVSRRLGDFAIAGAMCMLDFDAQRRCTAARCVVFAASDRPRVIDAAGQLVGAEPGDESIARVARAARDAISPLADHHASGPYRLELVEALVARVLKQAARPAAPRESLR